MYNQRLVEESHLLGGWRLKYLEPSGQHIAVYGGMLDASALNPVEKDIRRCREIVQLNSSAEGPGSKPQAIPL